MPQKRYYANNNIESSMFSHSLQPVPEPVLLIRDEASFEALAAKSQIASSNRGVVPLTLRPKPLPEIAVALSELEAHLTAQLPNSN